MSIIAIAPFKSEIVCILPNQLFQFLPNAHRLPAGLSRKDEEEGNKAAEYLSCPGIRDLLAVLHETDGPGHVRSKVRSSTLQHGLTNVTILVDTAPLCSDEQELHVVLGASHERPGQSFGAVPVRQTLQDGQGIVGYAVCSCRSFDFLPARCARVYLDEKDVLWPCRRVCNYFSLQVDKTLRVRDGAGIITVVAT